MPVSSDFRVTAAAELAPAADEDASTLAVVIMLTVILGLFLLGVAGVLTYTLISICIGRRRVKLENTIPGSLDDEFEIEERLSELSPNEQNLYRSGQDFIKQHPPFNDPLSLSSHLIIQEKGVEAWEFIPDPNLPSDAVYINDKTEINFNSFDYQCSIQTNLPIPKVNDVYYFETKIFRLDSPNDTTVSVGLSTKPYPYFRLPGRHLYSVAYDSNGSRRVNNSFKLPKSESSAFPKLQQGDVVGVGYRVRSGTIFFTRNGKKVSEKSIGGHIKGMRMNNLFPTIGSNNPCSVHVNLGQYGYVFIEANIKKWGYALKEGTRPPLPDYNSSSQDLLIESSNEDDDEVINPPDFYENAGYESSSYSLQDNITLNTLPAQPPTYEEDEQHESDNTNLLTELEHNTVLNQLLDDADTAEENDYEARLIDDRDESPES